MALLVLHRIGAKKFISRLEYDAAKTDRIILLLRKKSSHAFGSVMAVLSAQRRVCPVRRKENVAGPLNFAEQLESPPDIFFGLGPAQRMIEIRQPFRSPWFTPSIPDVRETLEKFI